jgi:hypothetical protein
MASATPPELLLTKISKETAMNRIRYRRPFIATLAGLSGVARIAAQLWSARSTAAAHPVGIKT